MSAEPEGLVFVGNWRDAIPRALIFDPILDAISVRVYLFLFTQVTPHDPMPFPSYGQIGQRLHLSKPTVVRAMHLLRTTRWVTQAGEVRGPDGRFLRNTYLLHDEPLSLGEAIRLDGHYLAYLEGLLNHGHPRVRMAASAILTTLYDRFERREDVADNPSVEDRIRWSWRGDGIGYCPVDSACVDAYHEALAQEDEEDGDDPVKTLNPVKHRVKMINPAENGVKTFNPDPALRVNEFNSDTEVIENTDHKEDIHMVNMINPVDSSSSSSFKDFNKKTTTTALKTPRAREAARPDVSHLVYSKHLSPDERRFAAMHLGEFPPDTQQALLDELAGQIDAKRTTDRPVRNPLRYLEWMCNQLRDGRSPFSSAGTKYRRLRQIEVARAQHEPGSEATRRGVDVSTHVAALRAALCRTPGEDA